MKQLFIAGLLLAMAAVPAVAAETSDKFAKMDTDGSDSVSWEEFHKTYPQMQRGAFDSIDKNKDEAISRREWDAFTEQHSKGMAGHGAGGMPPAGMPDTSGHSPKQMPPIITPPSK